MYSYFMPKCLYIPYSYIGVNHISTIVNISSTGRLKHSALPCQNFSEIKIPYFKKKVEESNKRITLNVVFALSKLSLMDILNVIVTNMQNIKIIFFDITYCSSNQYYSNILVTCIIMCIIKSLL